MEKVGGKIKRYSKFPEEISMIGYHECSWSKRIQNTSVDVKANSSSQKDVEESVSAEPITVTFVELKDMDFLKTGGQVADLTIDISSGQTN